MKFILQHALLLCSVSTLAQNSTTPKVCFTFDDPHTNTLAGYSWNTRNALIINKLKANNVQAVLFVCGMRINSSAGDSLVQSWDKAGHLIANHSFTHSYYHSKKYSVTAFKADFLKNDSLIKQYVNYTKLFRFPYLKEGNTIEKRNNARHFMDSLNYANGHVTIDASDWYYDSRLIDTLTKNPTMDITPYKTAYLTHIINRAMFYDSLGTVLTGRKINHTLLLHHNLVSALFINDLIQLFKTNGWLITTPTEAYSDPIVKISPKVLPAGESLLWSIAKESGKYESILRYPAEDEQYEKALIDAIK